MNKILGYFEGLFTLLISSYIFWLLFTEKFSLMFNPKYRILALLNADILFVLGLYSIVFNSKSNYGRVLSLGLIVFFMWCIRDFIVNPDMLIQMEIMK